MAEKEYIERGAVLEAIRFVHKPIVPTGSLADRFCKSVEETIMEQPAANVIEVVGDINRLKEKFPPIEIWVGTDKSPVEYVPVVRCKDCEFRYTKECPQFILPLDDNGFCSYGERKE